MIHYFTNYYFGDIFDQSLTFWRIVKDSNQKKCLCVQRHFECYSIFKESHKIRESLQTALLSITFESQGVSLSKAALKCRAQLHHSAGDSSEHKNILKEKRLEFRTFPYL